MKKRRLRSEGREEEVEEEAILPYGQISGAGSRFLQIVGGRGEASSPLSLHFVSIPSLTLPLGLRAGWLFLLPTGRAGQIGREGGREKGEKDGSNDEGDQRSSIPSILLSCLA